MVQARRLLCNGMLPLTLGLPQAVMREIGGSVERYLYGHARLAQVNMLGVRTWAHADALGTPRLTHTMDGVIVDAPRTDAWDRPLHGTEPQPFGFTGELQDRETDLVYLRARWYSPTSGTFLSRDPFAGYPNQPYSLHPYQYAYSAPTTWSDPSGELAIVIAGRGSETRAADPLGNQSSLIRIWELGTRLKDLIRGNTIIASWNTHEHIRQNVMEVAPPSCQQEPIILIGHRRGAETAMDVSEDLGTMPIDVFVPWDMVHRMDIHMMKPKHGRRHSNRVSLAISPYNELVKDVAMVSDQILGAENYRIPQAYHQTLDNEFLDSERTQVNPVWSSIEEAIRRVR